MSENTERKTSRWKKIVLLQLIVFPVIFVLADLGYRFATDYEPEATRTEVAEIVESMLSGVPDPGRKGNIADMQVADLGLHPYLGFADSGAIKSHAREIAKARRAAKVGEYRIMILGGSVAGGFGNPTSPGVVELRKMLKRDARFEGRTIRYIALGHGSYKQPQQLILANYLIGSGVRPHAIINLDGFNEVALTLQNSMSGMNPIYPSYSQWIHLTSSWGTDTNDVLDALLALRETQDVAVEFADFATKWKLHYSSLLGALTLKAMRGFQWRHSTAATDYRRILRVRPDVGPLAGPGFPKDEATVLHDAVQMWSASSQSLDALCEKLGIFYLNVLQPTLHDKGSKVLTPVEQTKGQALPSWVRGAGLGYPLLREAGQQLRASGVNFVDASMAFLETERTLYYDACHFGLLGNGILGKLIGKAFLADLPEGDLPE